MEKLIELDVAIDTAIDAADEWDCGFSFERDRKIRDAFMALPTVDAVPVVRCKDCKHNPKLEWFGCPMASLSEKQRPETAWCWRGERKDGDHAEGTIQKERS